MNYNLLVERTADAIWAGRSQEEIYGAAVRLTDAPDAPEALLERVQQALDDWCWGDTASVDRLLDAIR